VAKICPTYFSPEESYAFIQYKLGVLVYQCLLGDAPSYLADMISPVGNVSQRQRSAAQGNLTVPPNTESSHGSAELCSLWPNTMEIAAGRT